MIKTWRLDTDEQTLVLASVDGAMASVVYWGAPLPKAEDLTQLARAVEIDLTGGMIDKNADLSICPQSSQNFVGQAGLAIRDRHGNVLDPRFVMTGENIHDGVVLTFNDVALRLTYSARFTADPATNIMMAHAKIVTEEPIIVDWFAAPVMPAPQLADRVIDFGGRWCGEFNELSNPWSVGARVRDNRTGRTGHEYFPAILLPEMGATNTHGAAYAMHYGWSGGHRMVTEELPDGRRQIQFGHASAAHRAPVSHVETAPLYLTYSAKGINGCARSFQRHIRDRVLTPANDRPRPVHYNCWEAVYFDHDLDILRDIASRAAQLGAERFVLDDGWFGKRDDDTSSLGDWFIDERKYPEGLKPLIDHVRAQGMSFGLWFEPEMVNPNSDLYRAHPDWALGASDQVLGRRQMALDMANPKVVDYLFDAISALLGTYEIEYIKWDHNRILPVVDSVQTQGSYALIDRLRAAFPHVELESCASGGGRIDFGILSRVQRVWLSDSNDPLERARIQYGAAAFLPASVTGSHVGPRTSHTSGRTHDIHFRAWIAAQRHMGFEMDPRELTDNEARVLANTTAWWKAERNWLMRADIGRLDAIDTSILAEQHMAEDRQQFVVFVNKIDSSTQIAPRPLRLYDLEPSAQYQIELVNRGELHHLSRGTPALKAGILKLSGQYLMRHGVSMPWSFPNRTWVLKGRKVS